MKNKPLQLSNIGGGWQAFCQYCQRKFEDLDKRTAIDKVEEHEQGCAWNPANGRIGGLTG